MTTPPEGLDRLLKQLASITPRQMAISQIALEDATGELAGKIKAACQVPEIAENVYAQEARPDQVEIQTIKAEWALGRATDHGHRACEPLRSHPVGEHRHDAPGRHRPEAPY